MMNNFTVIAISVVAAVAAIAVANRVAMGRKLLAS